MQLADLRYVKFSTSRPHCLQVTCLVSLVALKFSWTVHQFCYVSTLKGCRLVICRISRHIERQVNVVIIFKQRNTMITPSNLIPKLKNSQLRLARIDFMEVHPMMNGRLPGTTSKCILNVRFSFCFLLKLKGNNIAHTELIASSKSPNRCACTFTFASSNSVIPSCPIASSNVFLSN